MSASQRTSFSVTIRGRSCSLKVPPASAATSHNNSIRVKALRQRCRLRFFEASRFAARLPQRRGRTAYQLAAHTIGDLIIVGYPGCGLFELLFCQPPVVEN